MKKLCLYLLAALLLFSLCACDLDRLFTIEDDRPAPTTTTPTATPTPTPTTDTLLETTGRELLWDPAAYQAFLGQTAEAYAHMPDNCYYLLYDITQDNIPELMIKTATDPDDASLSIYTQESCKIRLLGKLDGIMGMPCGYLGGEGLLICDVAHPDSINYVMLVTHSGGSLVSEMVLDHYEFLKNRFTALDTWALADSMGLAWEANPEDTNAAALKVLREEELRLHTNLLDSLSDEEVHRINIFLSNFSEQDMENLALFDQYDYLSFVYSYCTINRKDMLTYSDGYAYISLGDVNHVLNQYFDTVFTPNGEYMSFSDIHGSDIVYQKGKLRYKAGSEKAYNYVTIVTEVIEGKGNSYDVTFQVYSVQGHALNKYYGLRPSEVDQHPEMKPMYWGQATVKDYTRPDGAPSYQLLGYLPIKQ